MKWAGEGECLALSSVEIAFTPDNQYVETEEYSVQDN